MGGDRDNRLVADELEGGWNEALQRVREVGQQIEQHGYRQAPAPASRPEEFAELAAELEAVWQHPDADARLKKRIVRTLIREVVVDVDAAAGEVLLVIHWKGGVHTELRLPRRRRGQNSQHTSPEIVAVVRVLAQICSDPVIAGVLNRHGLRTGRGNRWTQERVTALRSHHGIPCYDRDRRVSEGWMNLTEAATVLRVSARTLRLAVERGELAAQHPLPDGPWVFRRDALITPMADKLVERVRRGRRDAAIPLTQQDTFRFSGT